MQITKVFLSNFKSFGKENQCIPFDEITAIIGANSTGKTSLITALLRLFGQKNTERNLIKSDFHIPSNVNPNEVKEISLQVEAKIEFPELVDQELEEIESIPNYIKQLVVERTGGIPYIRIRLNGTWIESQHPEGDIEQKISYVTVPYGEDEDNAIHPVPLHHRKLVQMIYVPAMRDPVVQLKNASGSLLWRIFNNVIWPEDFNEKVQESTSPVIDLFDGVEDVKSIQTVLNREWNKYHRESRFRQTDIIFNSTDLETILKNIEVAFSPNEEGLIGYKYTWFRRWLEIIVLYYFGFYFVRNRK